MNRFTRRLFVFCVLISFTSPTLSGGNAHISNTQSSDSAEVTYVTTTDAFNLTELKRQTPLENEESSKERSLKTKPLRSIVMGIYKNYKSTYLGNKTLAEYKQTLRESMKNKLEQQQQNISLESASLEDGTPLPETKDNVKVEEEDKIQVTDVPIESVVYSTTMHSNTEAELLKKVLIPQTEQYQLGPALNMSLDFSNSIIKVNLDGESLKELVTGRWLSDNTDEGRGKKYEMVTRILPLFILPFLIQSAIVPFLVTKLKLLLMKSMLVGKLAIFLLIISAFRNGNKMMQTYEVAPSYWASEPSRRSEMAAAASNMAYNGYRVEGKPTAWIN